MKKLLLIINPNAGRMKAGSILLRLVTAFSANGYEVTVFPTVKRGDAERIAYINGKAFDLVVCYGGDGTLSETINGLMRISEPPSFSFITAGTSNDFARTVSMPTNVERAVEKIINGADSPLDIGSITTSEGERFFVYVAAFGLFTSVSYVVPQGAKKVFGHLAYVAEGVKQTIDIPAYKMTIEYDGTVVTDEFAVGLIANTTSVAGMFKLNRSKVQLDDGKFELILVKNPNNPILLSKIMMDLSAQKFHSDYVIFERVSNVKITSEEGQNIAWCLDGESGGVHKNVEISNLHSRGTIRL
ncbi:MAG: YegS/Rv2252/BmrU family lipid kinase [Oscillospiraceae bacterium]|nr:YegS/Rv2252/BmrU family lipid kinase [Oscillospiraceae bacterium]